MPMMSDVQYHSHTAWQQACQKIAHMMLVLTAFFVPISITGTNICMTLAALCSLLCAEYRQQLVSVFKHPIIIAGLLIVVVAVASSAWAVASAPYQLSSLHKYAKLLYLPFLVPLFLNKYVVRNVINGFLLAIFITAVLSFYKAGWFGGEELLNSSWVFHSHIETSYFFAIAAYIVATRLWFNEKRLWSSAALLLVFSLQEFFINDGGTGYVIFLLLCLVFLIQRFGLRGLLIGCMVGLLSLGMFYQVSKPFQKKMSRSLKSIQQYDEAHNNKTSLAYRYRFAKLSMHLIKEKPLLGYGVGGFLYEYQHGHSISGWKGKLNTPHNEYLLMAVQFGFLGLILFLYFTFKPLFLVIENQQQRWLLQGFVLAFATGCSFNPFLYTTVTGHFYILFAAMLFFTHKKCLFD
jgi:O-antigen ligase